MNSAEIITDYVYERMGEESVSRRITLVSALADIASTPAEKRALLHHKAQLEAIEITHQQLLLNLRTRRVA